MQNLLLSNTLSKKKEIFVPIDKNNIRMYVCGPTVYDFPHIGNARPLIVFDILFRVLKTIYGKDNVYYSSPFAYYYDSDSYEPLFVYDCSHHFGCDTYCYYNVNKTEGSCELGCNLFESAMNCNCKKFMDDYILYETAINKV